VNRPDQQPTVVGVKHDSRTEQIDELETAADESASGDFAKIISDLFQGTAETVTQCMQCETSNSRAESFLDVSLPVQLGRSLTWSLANHGKDEIMAGSNKYACGFCNTYQEARQCWRVSKIPPMFTIHLKLFAFACGRPLGAKVPAAMPCPFTLRLTKWCTADCRERDITYHLWAVIVHDGSSSSSGHYYAYINVPDEGWHNFDDGDVMQSSEEELRRTLFTSLTSRTTAYLLFYKRDDDETDYDIASASRSSASADGDTLAADFEPGDAASDANGLMAVDKDCYSPSSKAGDGAGASALGTAMDVNDGGESPETKDV
jgi:hypothetical protein